jgi:3-hydroxyisobutyrate dehydrogenase
VEAATLGLDGVIEGLWPGSTDIDLSTIDPVTCPEGRDRLSARGVRMLDVPVSKEPAAAGAGTLMIGGDPEVIKPCQDAPRAMGSTHFDCGGWGAGRRSPTT